MHVDNFFYFLSSFKIEYSLIHLALFLYISTHLRYDHLAFFVMTWYDTALSAKLKESQNATNAVRNASANGGGGGSNGGVFADQNPFVAAREAQRMVGNYPEDDVARASLEQLNEISRRAAAAGMSFANGVITNGDRPVTPTSILNTVATVAMQNQQGSPESQDVSRGATNPNGNSSSTSSEGNTANLTNLSREDTLQRIEELARQRPASASGIGGVNGMQQGPPQQQVLPSVQYASGSDPFIMPGPETTAMNLYAGGGQGGRMTPPPATSITHSGLQVFTLGHLMPKSTGDDDSAIWTFDPARAGLVQQEVQQQQQQQQQQQGPSTSFASSSSANGAATSSLTESRGGGEFDGTGMNVVRPGSAQKLRVRRSTFVPGWAVPPRVLLVDDDAVSRKLSSKFLQVFGCTIDVAVDGVVAVNKMNLEKYDLVLMVSFFPISLPSFQKVRFYKRHISYLFRLVL